MRSRDRDAPTMITVLDIVHVYGRIQGIIVGDPLLVLVTMYLRLNMNFASTVSRILPKGRLESETLESCCIYTLYDDRILLSNDDGENRDVVVTLPNEPNDMTPKDSSDGVFRYPALILCELASVQAGHGSGRGKRASLQQSARSGGHGERGLGRRHSSYASGRRRGRRRSR